MIPILLLSQTPMKLKSGTRTKRANKVKKRLSSRHRLRQKRFWLSKKSYQLKNLSKLNTRECLKRLMNWKVKTDNSISSSNLLCPKMVDEVPLIRKEMLLNPRVEQTWRAEQKVYWFLHLYQNHSSRLNKITNRKLFLIANQLSRNIQELPRCLTKSVKILRRDS